MEPFSVLLASTALVGLVVMFTSRARDTGSLLRHVAGVSAGFFCAACVLLSGLFAVPDGLTPLAFASAPALVAWGVYRDEPLR